MCEKLRIHTHILTNSACIPHKHSQTIRRFFHTNTLSAFFTSHRSSHTPFRCSPQDSPCSSHSGDGTIRDSKTIRNCSFTKCDPFYAFFVFAISEDAHEVARQMTCFAGCELNCSGFPSPKTEPNDKPTSPLESEPLFPYHTYNDTFAETTIDPRSTLSRWGNHQQHQLLFHTLDANAHARLSAQLAHTDGGRKLQ